MAMDSEYQEVMNSDMGIDEVATLLVKLYAEYMYHNGCENEDYAKAVGIAIRMLTNQN